MAIHQNLSQNGWRNMTLVQQMGNIGSEVSRTARWQNRDAKLFQNAAYRALELFDLTLSDPRWRGRYVEIARAREVFCDLVFGQNEYRSSLKDLLRYFDQFAYASRLHM